MSAPTTVIPSNIEAGLKYQIARQRNMKLDTKAMLDKTNELLLESWKSLAAYNIDAVEALAWDWAEKSHFSVEMNSEPLGIKTTIKDYENKQGKKTPSHFTHWGNYLGSTKKLGAEPIYFDSWFRVNKEQFEFIKTGWETMKLDAMFAPKKAAAVEEVARAAIPTATPVPTTVVKPLTVKLKRKAPKSNTSEDSDE